MGRSCLPNRVTLISFGGQSFVPRCPIDGIHRLKKSTFSQRCNSFRRNLRANGKGLFPPLFFSYQLNELFFIHPTTLRHPTFSLFFLPSDTGFCSSASERFLLFFTVSAYLSLFLYSLIPCRFFSATYHPLASDVIFLHENVLSPLLPLHLHLLTVVIFIILHRRFLFLNSYRRFHRYNFTSSLTRSLVAFVCPTGSFRLVFTRRPTTSSVFRSLFSGPSFLAFLLPEIIASGFVP